MHTLIWKNVVIQEMLYQSDILIRFFVHFAKKRCKSTTFFSIYQIFHDFFKEKCILQCFCTIFLHFCTKNNCNALLYAPNGFSAFSVIYKKSAGSSKPALFLLSPLTYQVCRLALRSASDVVACFLKTVGCRIELRSDMCRAEGTPEPECPVDMFAKELLFDNQTNAYAW